MQRGGGEGKMIYSAEDVASASIQIAERVEELNALVRAGNRHPGRFKRRRFQSSEDSSDYIITGISFTAFSEEQKQALSVREITTSTLYDQGVPHDDAPMSLYLGSNSPSLFCKTCGNPGGSMGLCSGHFGRIALAVRVFCLTASPCSSLLCTRSKRINTPC